MNDWSKELMHMTKAEKKEYNKSYYQQHKNYWSEYYSNGKTVGRPMSRPKSITQGNGTGVSVRPTSVRPANVPMARPKSPGRTYYGDAYNSSMHNWSNLVNQVSTPEQSHAYNQSLFGESGQAQLYQRLKARKKKVTSGIGVGTIRKDESFKPVRPGHKGVQYDSPIGPTLTGKAKVKKMFEQFGSNWKSGAADVKNAGKQFGNNWKSGSVDVKNAGKQFVSNWKSGATSIKKLFNKKR